MTRAEIDMIAEAVAEKVSHHNACHAFEASEVSRLKNLASVAAKVSDTATKVTVTALVGLVLTLVIAGIVARLRGHG